MMYLATAIAATIMLVLIGIGMRMVWSMELENRIAEAEVESSRLFQGMMDDRIEQVRRYRHDADALLRAIEQAAADENRPDSADAAVFPQGACESEVIASEGWFPLSIAALELQRRRCKEAGITFACDTPARAWDWLASHDVDDSDLCLLLQNLLDNAYEASEKVAPGEDSGFGRMMSLHIREDGGGLHIEVANRVASSEEPSLRTRKANPALHGIGLSIVEDIAKKHGGSASSTFDGGSGVFTVLVSLR